MGLDEPHAIVLATHHHSLTNTTDCLAPHAIVLLVLHAEEAAAGELRPAEARAGFLPDLVRVRVRVRARARVRVRVRAWVRVGVRVNVGVGVRLGLRITSLGALGSKLGVARNIKMSLSTLANFTSKFWFNLQSL